MCGGPSEASKQAQQQTSALDKALAQQYTSGTAVTQPFYTGLVTNPGQDPALAQQQAQQKAQMAAKNAGYGGALPSGFAAQENLDLGEQYGRAQDANMFARQMAGAQGLNPIQAAGTAIGGNQTVMNQPQNSFWQNLIGGLVQGGSQMGAAFLGA